MKRLCTLLLALLIMAALNPCPGMAQEEPGLLVLVYLCGTDLETKHGAATRDIQEMLEAGLPDDGSVAVLLQTGGTLKWQNEVVDSATTQRFLITDDLYTVADDLGQMDMGSPETLYDFICFAAEEYPSQRYGLVLWDHGGGSTGGVCWDQLTDNSLSAEGIHDALEAAGAFFEFIGFDACLMSTVEMAATLQPFAGYMIASEELEPGTGWAYDLWLRDLADDPYMDGVQIGRAVVDSYIESSLAADPNDYVTLSVTDLSQMDALCDALDALGETLSVEMDAGQYAPIARARAGMRAFGDFADAGSDMVDLGELAGVLSAIAPDNARALEEAVRAAVVYNRSSANIQTASGLSILLPLKTRASALDYLPEYDALGLLPGYTAFVGEYVDRLLSGDYTFTPSPIATQPLDMSDEQAPGWFEAFLQGIEQADHPAQAAQSYGDTAYTVTLPRGDLESLSYVEAALLQDAYDEVGDQYGEAVYFDFGYTQDVYVDWDNGEIYGLFDGNWPALEGQMVPMYDQIVTPAYTRSVIPAMVNGDDQYLLVVFNDENPGGLVMGYSEGYDDQGNPARGYQKLKPGDRLAPLYELIYWDEQDEMQTEVFEGDEITVGSSPLQFEYDEVESGIYSYAFCLNDIFGDYQLTDFWELDYR